MAGERIGTRATLCRCGESKNKPYCDGSHVAAAFVSTGEPPTTASAPLAKRDGVVSVKPYKDGPLGIAGPVEILTARGARSIGSRNRALPLRASGRKPYCDGSHARVGFTAP